MQPDYNQKSVVFISFHKCATSYFSREVLKHLNGLKLIDYLGAFYRGDVEVKPKIIESGYVYGVIRLQDADHPRFRFVKSFIESPEFFRLKQIYWTRDPRDILVSMYYSFGFSHGMSVDETFKEYQMQLREKYQKMTVDDCVLEEVDKVKVKFLQMKALMEASEDFIHLKYETMVFDFDVMYESLRNYVPLSNDIREDFFKQTRPRAIVNIANHRRSGGVGDYKNILHPETIKVLNRELEDVLRWFGYV